MEFYDNGERPYVTGATGLDLTPKRFVRIVAASISGRDIELAQPADQSVGLLLCAAGEIGCEATVAERGQYHVITTTAIVVGDKLTIAADGEVALAVPGDVIVGVAASNAAIGECVSVKINLECNPLV